MKMKRTTESKRLARLITCDLSRINIKHQWVEGYVVIKKFRQYEESDYSDVCEEYDMEFHGKFKIDRKSVV